MTFWKGFTALMGALVLSGCMGTPHLFDTTKVSDEQPSPSIGDVKTEIICELTKYKHKNASPGGKWFKEPYLVTATLLLQVDDYLDVTPTFNFIHPLAGAATNMRTVVASADLGGQRERIYTETFYIDSSKLDLFKLPVTYENYMSTTCNPEKYLRGNHYSLRGDLKLDEIVSNGERSIDSTRKLGPTATSNTNPSFGSTIEFFVTKNVTALGAQWSLVHLKGPGGNNGLLNGKKVTTDKLIVTLTKILPTSPSDSAKLATAVAKLTRVVDDDVKARQNVVDKQNQKVTAHANLSRIEGRFKALVKGRPGPEQVRELNAATREANARSDDFVLAQQIAANRAASVQDAKDELTQVYSEGTSATTMNSAAQANQNLQTTMILQSLNIQPR